jgi:hypothetical protein
MSSEKLAIAGGGKAVDALGPLPTKIGREELWELIDMWELSPGNKEKIREILFSDPDLR